MSDPRDHRALLAKYMAHVIEAEGVSMVGYDDPPSYFSSSEWEELGNIHNEVRDQKPTQLPEWMEK